VPKWEYYEQVGTYLLNQLFADFGLDPVEAKQDITGQRSETSWEIDPKGVPSRANHLFKAPCRGRRALNFFQGLP